MKDQNYYNTFIEIAEDCPASSAEIPTQKGNKESVPLLQYEMIAKHPYQYTQEDVIFGVFATRNEIPANAMEAERALFFSKGQP